MFCQEIKFKYDCMSNNIQKKYKTEEHVKWKCGDAISKSKLQKLTHSTLFNKWMKRKTMGNCRSKRTYIVICSPYLDSHLWKQIVRKKMITDWSISWHYGIIISFYLREWYSIWKHLFSNFLVSGSLTFLKITENPKVILFKWVIFIEIYA